MTLAATTGRDSQPLGPVPGAFSMTSKSLNTFSKSTTFGGGKTAPPQTTTGMHTSLAGQMDYPRLLAVFTAPHAPELADKRCASAVERVARVNAGGAAIRDLPYIEKLLNLAYDYVSKSGTRALEGPICSLMRALGKPFIRKSSTDEVKGLTSMASLLQTMASVFKNGMPISVQIEAAEALAAFASAYGTRGLNAEASPRQFHTNASILASSGALRLMVDGLRSCAVPGGDADLQGALVIALVQGSYTADCAAQISQAHVAEPVAALLRVCDFKSPTVFYSLGLLWNLLDRFPQAAALDGPTATNLPEALVKLLGTLLVSGFRAQDRGLRNEVLVLAKLLFAQGSPQVVRALIDSGMLRILLVASTSPELPASAEVIKPFNYSRDPLDFEFRRLAWGLLLQLCLQEKQWLVDATEAGFISVLLSYLSGVENRPYSARWLPAQLIDLQQDALNLLARLVPLAPVAVLRVGGPAALVQFAQRASSPASFASLSQTASASTINAARTGETRMVAAAASALAAAAQAEGLAGPLGEAGAVELCLQWLSDGGRAPLIRETAARVLAPLVASDQVDNAKRMRKAQGVSIVVEELRSHRHLDHTLHPPPQVAVTIALLKRGVIPHRKLLVRFLAEDGLETLLSLLEVCHVSLRPALLSVLADILKEPLARPMFLAWRGGGAPTTTAFAATLQSIGQPSALRAGALLNSTGAAVVGVQMDRPPPSRATPNTPNPQHLPQAPSVGGLGATRQGAQGATPPTGNFQTAHQGGGGRESRQSQRGGAEGDPTATASGAGGPGTRMSGLHVMTAPQLVIRLWRAEEQSQGLLGADGVLADPARPYGPSFGLNNSLVKLGGEPSRVLRAALGTPPGTLSAKPAVDGSLRYATLHRHRRESMARIGGSIDPSALFCSAFSVLEAVGFDNCGELSLEHQATLEAIRHYADFRLGEAWQDVRRGLAADGTDPVVEDLERLEQNIASGLRVAAEVVGKQRELLTAAQAAVEKEEQTFYEAKRTQEALERAARLYRRDRSNLTMRERAEAKARLASMVGDSLVESDCHGLFGDMVYTTDLLLDCPLQSGPLEDPSAPRSRTSVVLKKTRPPGRFDFDTGDLDPEALAEVALELPGHMAALEGKPRVVGDSSSLVELPPVAEGAAEEGWGGEGEGLGEASLSNLGGGDPAGGAAGREY